MSGVTVQKVKLEDGGCSADIIYAGVLNGIQGADEVTHTATASYAQSTPGEDIDITVNYSLRGTAAGNYLLSPASEVLTGGVIIAPILPDTTAGADGIEANPEGYCAGVGAISYHLSSGAVDEYKLVYDDGAFTDVDWTDIVTPAASTSRCRRMWRWATTVPHP